MANLKRERINMFRSFVNEEKERTISFRRNTYSANVPVNFNHKRIERLEQSTMSKSSVKESLTSSLEYQKAMLLQK